MRTLYNHVSGKDDLLGGMTELVVGEIDLPSDGTDWTSAMRRRATSAREVFSRHAWASALIDSRERSGPAALSYADRVLDSLLRAGFSPRVAANAFLVLDSYIYGFERQRADLSLGNDPATAGADEEVLPAEPPDGYPSLALVAHEFAVAPYDDAAAFAFGLGLILDGLQRQLGSD